MLWLGLVFLAGTPAYYGNSFSPSVRTELVLSTPVVNFVQVLAPEKRVRRSIKNCFYNRFALKQQQKYYKVNYYRQLQVKTKLLSVRYISYRSAVRLIRMVVPRSSIPTISTSLFG